MSNITEIMQQAGDVNPADLLGALGPIMALTDTLSRIEQHMAYQSAALQTLVGSTDVPGLFPALLKEQGVTNDMLREASEKLANGLNPLALLRGKS